MARRKTALPKSQVEAIFKAKLPKGTRVSAGAKAKMMDMAEGYLETLGQDVGMLAKSKGTKTLNIKDLKVVSKITCK